MSAITDKWLKATPLITDYLAGAISNATATTFTITNGSTDLENGEVYEVTIDKVDTDGDETGRREVVVAQYTSATKTFDCTHADYRGIEGVAQGHPIGAVVQVLATAHFFNQRRASFLTAHNQDGSHKADLAFTTPVLTAPSVKNLVAEVLTTAGGTTTYTLTPSTAITAYATGQEFSIKMNASNTGASTINISGLGAKSLTKGGATALASGDLLIDGVYKITYDGTQFQVSGIGGAAATAATRAENATGTSNTLVLTPQNQHEFNVPPAGFLYNGKIVPSVASNNLTVALKGIDGNDPSASNPVYVRIGDTVRTITAALSVTTNAGTSWASAGSAPFATKEIDWFVYLHYNTVASAISIGYGRLPYATSLNDFATFNDTNERTILHSTGTGNSTDYIEIIGRFAATLSAGAGYTWSVPTFTAKNLIQRPIFHTRDLSIEPTIYGSGGSIGTFASDRKYFFYKIIGERVFINYNVRITNVGSWSGNIYISAPFSNSTAPGQYAYLPGTIAAQGANATTASKGVPVFLGADNVIYFNSGVATASLQWSGVAANDQILINANYPIG